MHTCHFDYMYFTISLVCEISCTHRHVCYGSFLKELNPCKLNYHCSTTLFTYHLLKTKKNLSTMVEAAALG